MAYKRLPLLSKNTLQHSATDTIILYSSSKWYMHKKMTVTLEYLDL